MRKGTHTLFARSQNISREELKPLRMTKKYKLPTQQQSNDEIVSENINNRKLFVVDSVRREI